ncbi:MAG TPA: phosphatidylserine/phosphatidylglycerophosphate/cardiolipin synthase family protein, partial [Candidatus Dormibacteraeota bacterium]|nr:phosphatidylserine/phosphatidylglycerophosphate/cardiolipin synthase family protein [Candidatus Dormibacteraeota bacterium]
MVRVTCLLVFLLPLAGCSGPALAPAAPPPAGEVRLWQDASIFTLVDEMIGMAHRRVLVEMYELGRVEIVRALGAAIGRGATVRVITDPTVKESRDSAAQLDSLGVAERVYPIDDARHQIDHVKLLIADASAAVGGMNWGRRSDRHHDFVLQTRVAADVDRLTSIFEQDWTLAGGHPAPLPPQAVAVAQTAPGGEIRSMLEKALRDASHRIQAEVYTLTDPDVIAALALAHRRGVYVRVILDPNQEYNFHPFAVLRAAAVDVRWYPVPRGVLLHAKIGLFDGELIVGSANWTVSGLGVNHELDIKTRDPYAL